MSDANDTTSFDTSDLLVGRVKWFNNRAGFGFVTVLSGDKKNEDVFVHHTGISVDSEQYKYLVQGEYVNFVLKSSDSTNHPYQAGSVQGIMQGPLMCETRFANRSTNEGDESQPRTRSRGDRRRPRNGGNKNNEPNQSWVLERGSMNVA
mgnify:CR=1 FL=1